MWRPRGYAEKTAGVVVYVHGLYITVDGAWKDHRLAEQFAASGLNALFIAPEAPAGGGDPVLWPGLGTLILEVEKHLEVRVPRGPLVVMGHSGAYRTLVTWLDYKPLDRVILLDALYDNEPEFQAWLQARGRQLTLVEGKSTRERSQRFVKGLRRLATAMPSIPDEAARFTRRQRRARLLHVKSQYGHFELVTEGKAIPVLLGATGLPRL